jgi:hypothetical protein
MCGPNTTILRGTVYAPNGKDPIPNVRVYAASAINPFPADYCDNCALPLDPAYAETTTAADGTYGLTLDGAPASPTIEFTIQIGHFRKHTLVPVTCSASAQTVPAAAQTLPGNSTAGDIPKIAVSAGNADHLDAVLSGLGITEYDCVEGRKNAPLTPTATCPLTATSKMLPDILSNAATLATYNMAFVSCAPGAYKYFTTAPAPYSAATLSANTKSWVNNGGRIFVTDTAYDYIAQPFPSDITWAGPTGAPQPVDGANIGCAPPNNTTGPSTLYPVTVDDTLLAAWLKVVGFAASPNVQVQGFYTPWSAISSITATTDLITSGTMPVDPTYGKTFCATPTMQNLPLTAQFDVGGCGRVVFSSYHTYTGTGQNATAANQKIMEYLIFGAASCVN